MRLVPPRTLVIVNPRSANGSTGRRWRRLEPRVREALGAVDIEHTRGRRDAERLAREAVRSGIERIVVAGGDGTLGEVTSGLLGADLGGYAEIGLLPMGTGSDFARSLGIPRDPDAALGVLRSGNARRVDAGRLTCRAAQGATRTAHFANVASFGISALIDELVDETTKVFGGGVSFLLGTIRAILRYRSAPVAIHVDGEPIGDEPLVLAAAANGRYFGGGMKVAPESRVDDGLLDVVVVRDLPVRELLTKLPKIYRGTHLADPATRWLRGRTLEARARTDAGAGTAGDPERDGVRVELDGEPVGMLPARVDVLPGALAVVGPKS